MAKCTDADLPLTPLGRLFCQPLMTNVIHCAFSLEPPVDVSQFKAQLRTSLMLQHPRFCSLMVRDSRGPEQWRRTVVDVDRHVFVHRQPLSDDPSVSDEDAVNDFMADLSVSSPLPEDKPLWEIHLLLAHNTAVYRVHHALGDGTSLMSVFSGCRKEDPSEKSRGRMSAPVTTRRWWSVWKLVMVVWYTLMDVLEMLRILWVKDSTAFSGGAGVELWPRKLASARFRLDDMKMVKGAIAGATVNDVLLGIISCGLSRYLDMTSSPKEISWFYVAQEEGLKITGVSMVNLRQEKGVMQGLSDAERIRSGTQRGNLFGMLILPLYYHRSNSDPIRFVNTAKAMMDKKKLSMAALILYRIEHLITLLLGPKYASILIYRSLCNTSLMVSNMVGPKETITLGRNAVRSLRVSSTTLPHAMTMHMVSYAGTGYLQILVAKDVIPDPKVLARCFEDAMHDMKKQAEDPKVIKS